MQFLTIRVEVREFISPSGLMIQGTQNGLNSVSSIEGVASVQPVPLAMLVDFTVMDSLDNTPVRIESWRADSLLPGVDISDNWGMRLHQELDLVANNFWMNLSLLKQDVMMDFLNLLSLRLLLNLSGRIGPHQALQFGMINLEII